MASGAPSPPTALAPPHACLASTTGGSSSSSVSIPAIAMGCRYYLPAPCPSRTLSLRMDKILERYGCIALLHSCDIAGSGFFPLSKIPLCCLPWESGPCLSPSVAIHMLKRLLFQLNLRVQ